MTMFAVETLGGTVTYSSIRYNVGKFYFILDKKMLIGQISIRARCCPVLCLLCDNGHFKYNMITIECRLITGYIT